MHALARWRHRIQLMLCCQIPRRLWNVGRFPHPIGIVIGDGAQLGTDVWIYQNVTIGRGERGDPRYPALEDGVCVYAGAVIVGPITIGSGAVVGANAIVSVDVPPGATVVGHNRILQRDAAPAAHPRTAA